MTARRTRSDGTIASAAPAPADKVAPVPNVLPMRDYPGVFYCLADRQEFKSETGTCSGPACMAAKELGQ